MATVIKDQKHWEELVEKRGWPCDACNQLPHRCKNCKTDGVSEKGSQFRLEPFKNRFK